MALESGGGGGQSNAVRSGAAYVELFVKNNMDPGLNSAKQTLSGFAANAEGKLNAVGRAMTNLQKKSDAAMRSLNDSGKAVMGTWGKVAAFAAASTGAFAAAAAPGIERLNAAAKKADAEATERTRQLTRRQAEELGAAEETGRAEDVVAVIKRQMREEAERLQAADRALSEANNEYARMSRVGRFFVGGQELNWLGALEQLPIVGGGITAGREYRQANVNRAQSEFDESRKRQEALTDALKRAQKDEMRQARDARMREAEEAAALDVKLINVMLAADEAKKELVNETMKRAAEGMASLRGQFAGAFGGGGPGQFNFAQGQTRANPLEEARKQTDIQTKLLEIEKKMAADIAAIRAEGGGEFGP